MNKDESMCHKKTISNPSQMNLSEPVLAKVYLSGWQKIKFPKNFNNNFNNGRKVLAQFSIFEIILHTVQTILKRNQDSLEK